MELLHARQSGHPKTASRETNVNMIPKLIEEDYSLKVGTQIQTKWFVNSSR